MIRDPSDGSLRVAEEINPVANEINAVVAKTRSKEITSGLSTSKINAEELARLDESREWLQNYHQRSASPST